MSAILLFLLSALTEIAGCFCFWSWLRLGKSPLWTLPGIALLITFATLLTRINADFAGRLYAAYGGIYIAASLLWLWAVEGAIPDRYDLWGGLFCFAGAAIIIYGPRPA